MKSIVYKIATGIVMVLLISGCAGKGLLVVDDNVAKYMQESKKVVVYTPDVHIISVGVGSAKEDLINTKDALEEFKKLSFSNLSDNYVVNKLPDELTCGILEEDQCSNNLILDSRNIIKSIWESRGAFNATPENFEYYINKKTTDEFKDADLVVYINAVEFSRTPARITTDFLFSVTLGVITGYIPIVTFNDYANIIVYDRDSGKAILHDQIIGKYDLSDKEEVQEIVDRLLMNLYNNELLAMN